MRSTQAIACGVPGEGKHGLFAHALYVTVLDAELRLLRALGDIEHGLEKRERSNLGMF